MLSPRTVLPWSAAMGASKAATVPLRFSKRILTLPQHLAARRFRPVVFALLIGVIGSGTVLSVKLEQTTASIRQDSAPLFDREIPALGELVELDKALQLYERALTLVDADRNAPASIDAADAVLRRELSLPLERIHADAQSEGHYAELFSTAKHLVEVSHAYAQGLERHASPRFHGYLRAAIDRDLALLHAHVVVLEAQSRQAILISSQATESSVTGMTRMVHMFHVLALLAAVFMMYHVWVRFRAEDALAHQAGHDPLTGLPDRRSFGLRLQTLGKSPHTVVLGTIDRFGTVIGGYGHTVGDRMMQGLADRIVESASPYCGEVFRLGGANFAVLYPLDHASMQFSGAAHALIGSVHTPFVVDGRELFTSFSLGAAGYCDGATTARQSLPWSSFHWRKIREKSWRSAAGYCAGHVNRPSFGSAMAQVRSPLPSIFRHASLRNAISSARSVACWRTPRCGQA